jgi:hypothetical protein
MLIGLKEQVRPAVCVSLRPTVPLKPLIPTTLIVEFASRFVSTAELVGFAVTLKSTPVTATVVEDDSEAEVPVTVIRVLPEGEPAVTIRVAFCFAPTPTKTIPGTILVTKPQAQPFAVALRFTEPLKLPTLVTVIVEFTVVPAGIASACGLAERVKPWTTTVTVVDLNVVPLNPLTVTMYVPELEVSAVTVSVELAIPHWLQGGTLTVAGRRIAVGVEGPEGVMVAFTGTGPEKRLNVFIVTVEFADLPGSRVRVFGLALSV